MTRIRLAAALALPLVLGACAVPRPPTTVSGPVPSEWQASLPHGGRTGAPCPVVGAMERPAARAETARLTRLTAAAGFAAPATASLALASAADGAARLRQQRAQCEVERKALVALTGLTEADLAKRLATPWTPVITDTLFTVADLPAQVLAQRPDVRQAELAVAAASADVGAGCWRRNRSPCPH